MSLSPHLLFPLIAAGAVSFVVYTLAAWLFSRRTSASRAPGGYGQPPGSQNAPIATILSQKHKVRLFFEQMTFNGRRIDVSDREQLALYLAYAIVGLALTLLAVILGLPPLFWLGGPVIAYFAVNSLVNSKWNKVRMAMEKEIPTFLMNLSSVTQLIFDVPKALEDASLSPNPKGQLRPWINRLVHAIQSQGRKGLDGMQAEAMDISPSLVLVVVEITRLWETGGKGYSQSFKMISENLAGILEGRSKAYAKAEGAWSTIRVIVLALGGAIFMAFSNPGSGVMFRTPLAQVAILAGLGWAAFGWSYIGDLIREAVE